MSNEDTTPETAVRHFRAEDVHADPESYLRWLDTDAVPKGARWDTGFASGDDWCWRIEQHGVRGTYAETVTSAASEYARHAVPYLTGNWQPLPEDGALRPGEFVSVSVGIHGHGRSVRSPAGLAAPYGRGHGAVRAEEPGALLRHDVYRGIDEDHYPPPRSVPNSVLVTESEIDVLNLACLGVDAVAIFGGGSSVEHGGGNDEDPLAYATAAALEEWLANAERLELPESALAYAEHLLDLNFVYFFGVGGGAEDRADAGRPDGDQAQATEGACASEGREGAHSQGSSADLRGGHPEGAGERHGGLLPGSWLAEGPSVVSHLARRAGRLLGLRGRPR